MTWPLYHKAVPGLQEAIDAKDDPRTVMLLGEWLGSRILIPERREDLLDHNHMPLEDIHDAIMADAGGMWCGGFAGFIAMCLNEYGITSGVYNYGYHDENLSHVILVSLNREDGQFYPYDFYLGREHRYKGRNPSLGELLSLVHLGAHSAISIEQRPNRRRILTDAGKVETHPVDLDWFYGPDTPKWPAIVAHRGSWSTHVFWLDALLINPSFWLPQTRDDHYKVKGSMLLINTLIETLGQ